MIENTIRIIYFIILVAVFKNLFVTTLSKEFLFGIKMFSLFCSFWLMIYVNRKIGKNFSQLVRYVVAGYIVFVIAEFALALTSEYGWLGFLYHYSTYLGYTPMLIAIYSIQTATGCQIIKRILGFLFKIILIMLIGVVGDGLLIKRGVNYLSFIPSQDADGVMRANFLLEAPTNVFFYISVGLLICEKCRINRLVVTGFIVVSLFASLFAFSRLPLVLSVLAVSIYVVLNRMWHQLTAIGFFAAVIFRSLNEEVSIYTERFYAILDLAGDESRVQTYSRFFKHLADSSLWVQLKGAGLGASSSNFTEIFNKTYVGHFESSILLIAVEAGVPLAVLCILGAFIFFYRNLRQNLVAGAIVGLIIINLAFVPAILGFEVPLLIHVTILLMWHNDRGIRTPNPMVPTPV
jgi:hypothetical protein